MVEKCVGYSPTASRRMQLDTIQNFETERNHFLPCKMLGMEETIIDASDPYFPDLFKKTPGDLVNT
jgi:hypothetical protein